MTIRSEADAIIVASSETGVAAWAPSTAKRNRNGQRNTASGRTDCQPARVLLNSYNQRKSMIDIRKLKKVAPIKCHNPLPSFPTRASSHPQKPRTGGKGLAANVYGKDSPSTSRKGACGHLLRWKRKHRDILRAVGFGLSQHWYPET